MNQSNFPQASQNGQDFIPLYFVGVGTRHHDAKADRRRRRSSLKTSGFGQVQNAS